MKYKAILPTSTRKALTQSRNRRSVTAPGSKRVPTVNSSRLAPDLFVPTLYCGQAGKYVEGGNHPFNPAGAHKPLLSRIQ